MTPPKTLRQWWICEDRNPRYPGSLTAYNVRQEFIHLDPIEQIQVISLKDLKPELDKLRDSACTGACGDPLCALVKEFLKLFPNTHSEKGET